MKYGAMNNPMVDVHEEIALFADLGFDFIDLTLEPERTYSGTLDTDKVAKSLQAAGLEVVGHTAWYLPVASAFPEFRQLAINELKRCLSVFRDLGVTKVNLHPHLKVPLHDENWIIEHNVGAFEQVVAAAIPMGITIMLENMPAFSHVHQLRPIMDAVPEAGFLLDVGHANLDTPYNRTFELLGAFGSRLRHVHMSDNRGGHDDMHLPLGVGNIKWPDIVAGLKGVDYDDTITLEVFGDDDDYLALSRQKISKLWDAA
jgi:sugar phosphate isomerase/epimerase